MTTEVKSAKRSYAEKIKNRLSANDPASAWRGPQNITDYLHGFNDGDKGGRPRCRHGTGARAKLKGFIVI